MLDPNPFSDPQPHGRMAPMASSVSSSVPSSVPSGTSSGIPAAPPPSDGPRKTSDGRLQSLAALINETEDKLRRGLTAGAQVWPTRFPALDRALAGGVRSGELLLLGGPQGQGKTTMAMQFLRNAVAVGHAAVIFSYEHEAHTLLERLLALEAAEAKGIEAARVQDVRKAFEEAGAHGASLGSRLGPLEGGSEALSALTAYGNRLHVHESTGTSTDLGEIRRVVEEVRESTGRPPMVLVDYLQKVPTPGGPVNEDERATMVVEQLKDLALDLEVPVIAIVAAEKASLVAGHRMRIHDLRGSSSLAYEADIVLIINDKYDIVAKQHLVYDLGNVDRFRHWVVLSLEKNRNGVDRVDLEFRKMFEHGRFDPHGQIVNEQLIEERVFVT
jgi:replicative DNA helicase